MNIFFGILVARMNENPEQLSDRRTTLRRDLDKALYLFQVFKSCLSGVLDFTGCFQGFELSPEVVQGSPEPLYIRTKKIHE